MRSFLAGIVVVLLCASQWANAGVIAKCIEGQGLTCSAVKGDLVTDDISLAQSGNDSKSVVELALFLATGQQQSLSLYGKSDDDPQLFDFYGFNQGSSLETSNGGFWSLVNSGVNISYITVKASTGFLLIDANDSSSGIYSTMGLTTKGGQQPNVSHISFWLTGDNYDVDVAPVWALMLMGFVAWRMKRRNC